MKETIIDVKKIQYGDVLLFPTKMPGGVYETVKKYINNLADLLLQISKQKYIHQEIVIQGRYTLQQTGEGVYIIKRNLDDFKYLTIIRHKDFSKVTFNQYLAVIRKYWNLPYDWQSLFRNTLVSLMQQLPAYEEFMQNLTNKLLHYENKNMMICSEVVQRIFSDLGLKVSDEPLEYISPQNLFDSKYFIKIHEVEV